MGIRDITQVDNTYVADKLDNNIKTEIEIGDSKQKDVFYPQAKLKQWDNETNFSIRYNYDIKDATQELIDGKVNWKSNDKKREVNLYELENDGFEIEIVLNEKPDSNIIEYSLQTKGLNFFYQPELTKEELDNGHSRPINVVGSYAVYHKTQVNNKVDKDGNPVGNQYKSGKAFHIYRPEAIDKNGNKIWCLLNINEEDNLLTIEVPQEFLDKATYPVIVDPTFGNTGSGGSGYYCSTNYAYVFKGAAPSNGTVNNVTIECANASGDNFKAIICNGTNGNILTNGIGNATAGAMYSQATCSFSTDPTIVSGTQYYYGVVTDSNPTLWYDNGLTYSCYNDSNSYSSPESIGSSPSSTNKILMWINYTATSTGWEHTINGITAANMAKVNGVAKADIEEINGV